MYRIDKDAIFHEEVDDEQVPGYSQIIKHKMSLVTMETKMEEYKSLKQLKVKKWREKELNFFKGGFEIDGDKL